MTIETLAESAGLSPHYLNKLELGKYMPTIDTLLRIAEALDVSVAEVVPKPSPSTSAKRQKLEELEAFASQFSADEIDYMQRVLKVVTQRPRR